MSDFDRIERLIREARVQRSAMIGMALGNFLATAWQGIADLGRKAAVALGATKPRSVRTGKTLAAR